MSSDNLLLALVVLLPGRAELEALRSEHDHAWPRWPEHVTLLHPLPASAIAGLEAVAAVAAASADATVSVSQSLVFDSIGSFVVNKATASNPGRVSFHLCADAASDAILQDWYKTFVDQAHRSKRRPFVPHLTIAQCECADAPAMLQELEAWLAKHGPFVWESINCLSVLERPLSAPAQPFIQRFSIPLGVK